MFNMTTFLPSTLTVLAIATVCASPVFAEARGVELLRDADINSNTPDVSPIRRIDRELPRLDSTEAPPAEGFRTFNGSLNNLAAPLQGAAGEPLLRIAAIDYADGIAALAGPHRAGAREVSNALSESVSDRPNAKNASDFLWQWGQFLDHDIDLTDGADPVDLADIAIPSGDVWFDPDNNGDQILAFNRSLSDPESGTGIDNPRQQSNEISAWIDASNVYGSDAERARALRALDGSGMLKVSAGELLPFNVAGFANAGGDSDTLFFAGDVRANEQVGLTAMHTLFVREHNRLAEIISNNNPGLNGDQVYLQARRLVGAELQIITYQEYLPLLLGRDAMPLYTGYKPMVNGSIANLFSTALYRYGHSALSPQLLRLDALGNEDQYGHLPLRNAFFAPYRISDEGGIEPILRGLSSQVCQTVDLQIIDEVRNFLFGDPGAGGFDLAALNIQRGRDHGLPSYNRARVALGLAAAETFADISANPDTVQGLARIYASVDDVDVWIGGLAEDHRAGAMVGELIYTAVLRQFIRLRDGDRFWYQHSLNGEEMRMLGRVRLSDIIRRNTMIGDEIPDDVFRVSTGNLDVKPLADNPPLRRPRPLQPRP